MCGRWYLLVWDYCSRYPEVVSLRDLHSSSVVDGLKVVFARHGIPVLLTSDNGLQYAGVSFRNFARVWGFEHVTSSPRYHQSNGATERAIQTVRAMLKKAEAKSLTRECTQIILM